MIILEWIWTSWPLPQLSPAQTGMAPQVRRIQNLQSRKRSRLKVWKGKIQNPPNRGPSLPKDNPKVPVGIMPRKIWGEASGKTPTLIEVVAMRAYFLLKRRKSWFTMPMMPLCQGKCLNNTVFMIATIETFVYYFHYLHTAIGVMGSISGFYFFLSRQQGSRKCKMKCISLFSKLGKCVLIFLIDVDTWLTPES